METTIMGYIEVILGGRLGLPRDYGSGLRFRDITPCNGETNEEEHGT